jgi:hypothetical protein
VPVRRLAADLHRFGQAPADLREHAHDAPPHGRDFDVHAGARDRFPFPTRLKTQATMGFVKTAIHPEPDYSLRQLPYGDK